MTHAVNVDIAALEREDGTLRALLVWGDKVEVIDQDTKRVKVAVTTFTTQPDGSVVPVAGTGFLARSVKEGRRKLEVVAPLDEAKVLGVDIVDVQQGDASVIETPAGRVITLDGGDNQLFARYLASRYRGTSAAEPLAIEAMVVTHGDADHFLGLAEILKSETNASSAKRIFAQPQRVFHNGLVKRPSSVADKQSLGKSVTAGGRTLITGLETDLLAVPDKEMNTPFKTWKRALRTWADRSPIEFRHLAIGDNDAFDFLANEGLTIEVLGPVPLTAGGQTGLPFLGDVSHTINGHSVVLRLTYGNVRMLFAGDLNTESEQTLVSEQQTGNLELRSEVFKVPHHGSHEFAPGFLDQTSPVASVVSSGDESARKEYMHPRATLMAALGRSSRDAAPVVFATELVAFFETVGWVRPDGAKGVDDKPPKAADRNFFAFRRDAYGLVRIRTDGQRLLVSTNSARRELKEAYAWTTAQGADPVSAPLRRA